MKVSVLYLNECQNAPLAFDLVKQVVREQGVDARVTQVEVKNMDDAQELRFFGSPTIQVNGVDIDPSARSQTGFVFG